MASHLSRAQLDELDSALRQRRRELRQEIQDDLLSRDNRQDAELAQQVHDAEEEAVASLLADLNLTFLERHLGELDAVEDALNRLREGRYGICEDTGEPIPFDRLQANPTATRTLDAQARHEQHQPRPPTL